MAQVDVLLPIRGARRVWLQETLRSLHEQSEDDWRLVAVLHPSQPEFAELIERSVRRQVVVWATETGNLSDALNEGLLHCSAPIVARIDQDDIALPDRLSMQVDRLKCAPDCVALGSWATLIDDQGSEIGHRRTPISGDEILKTMRWRNAIMHPTVAFRRDVVESVGGYSPHAANVEDYELWLRMLPYGTIMALPEYLTKYRIHSGQMTQTRSISPSAARVVWRSRRALADALEESTTAAGVRQVAWYSKQWGRSLTRQA